jgi:hypothetical protein
MRIKRDQASETRVAIALYSTLPLENHCGKVPINVICTVKQRPRGELRMEDGGSSCDR